MTAAGGFALAALDKFERLWLAGATGMQLEVAMRQHLVYSGRAFHQYDHMLIACCKAEPDVSKLDRVEWFVVEESTTEPPFQRTISGPHRYADATAAARGAQWVVTTPLEAHNRYFWSLLDIPPSERRPLALTGGEDR